MIRPATTSDAEVISQIYNHYILNTVVTFEEVIVTASEMAARIQAVQDHSLPWLVCELDNRTVGKSTAGNNIVGYAYAGIWNGRSAYRFSVECTVYLDHAVVKRGLGTALYDALFAMLRSKKLHSVIGGIALPNEASVALHEKFGLTKAAHYKEVGFKFDRWIDVGYWQVLL
ncbi:MAG TPA: GNAT family N-acetyltransferase [Spongiibacteraceae bacterium]|nr:GNAT family N-acetyltransferase [Spongiibacteraceae bacterium]